MTTHNDFFRPYQIVMILAAATLSSCSASSSSIDRQAVVSRHNPHITQIDSLSSLSVGNGHFATTVDVTGMQSFPEIYAHGIPLTSMSDWGWHSFPNTEGLKAEESWRTMRFPHRNHDEIYAVEYKQGGRQQQATAYFRQNPHRLNLGTVGLWLTDATGCRLSPSSLTDIEQKLDMWNGIITSHFCIDGTTMNVTTACRQDCDGMVYHLRSAMLKEGRAKIRLRLSYPSGMHSDDGNDWQAVDLHTSRIVVLQPRAAVVEHTLDSTRYYITMQWDAPATLTADGNHVFTLSCNTDDITLHTLYSQQMPDIVQPSDISAIIDNISAAWHRYWNEGGMLDCSQCTDPRADELERRVVQSLYLTRINCAGSMPPQETGLTSNSWFGRPHLEMAWWHMLHFSLWGHTDIMQQMMRWYDDTAFDVARQIALRQGFDGVRWMKMTDPWAGEAPSNTGSFLIWQQPHYIYMAEELYRRDMSVHTLQQYARGVEATARFMADYLTLDTVTHTYYLRGATAMQESMSKDFSYNHPFELAYWHYGLSTAQRWRERQHLPRNAEWDVMLQHLAPLPADSGIYTAGLPLQPFDGEAITADFDPFVAPQQISSSRISRADFYRKSHSDHPAVMGVAAIMSRPTATWTWSTDTMTRTLDHVVNQWNWPTTWGWDYGMLAMAAARLGEPQRAVDLLLADQPKNRYLVQGHNYQTADRLRLYMPGNGALLTAVAMMCAGWDGAPEVSNPGFPTDGTWKIRWEGMNKMQ